MASGTLLVSIGLARVTKAIIWLAAQQLLHQKECIEFEKSLSKVLYSRYALIFLTLKYSISIRTLLNLLGTS